MEPVQESVWTPVERTLHAERRHDDPFVDVDLRVRMEHESGRSETVPGFWDGGNCWRFRFAPPLSGRWSYETSTDVEDAGLSTVGSFVAHPYDGPNPIRRHGFLHATESHLSHDDDTPFFWLADTAWSAGAKATEDEWRRYLTAREAQGFTAVQLNPLPQHDASRPYDRLPFGPEWNLDVPNPAYFQALY